MRKKKNNQRCRVISQRKKAAITKNRENFLRYAILIVDHCKAALLALVNLHCTRKNKTFQEFIDANQHAIYHLCYSTRCCQCQKGYNPPRNRILHPSQLEILFDKTSRLSCHNARGRNNFCCSAAKPGILSDVLDLTIARCLLVNFCIDLWWDSCLIYQGQTIQMDQFCMQNRHTLYHLSPHNSPCCQCSNGYVIPANQHLITTNQWKLMFSLPSPQNRKRPHPGNCICTLSANNTLNTVPLDLELQNIILQYCCSLRKHVEDLVKFRNHGYGHVRQAKMTDAEYNTSVTEIEHSIMTIARMCNVENQFKKRIHEARNCDLDEHDETMRQQYHTKLLEMVNKHSETDKKLEKISDKIAFKAAKLPTIIAEKVPKIMEKVTGKIESTVEKKTSNIEKQITMLKKTNQPGVFYTQQEIESHMKEGTFVETEVVRASVIKSKEHDVIIITGSEGIGKTRCSLEIIRQLSETYKYDPVKVTDFKDVKDVLDLGGRKVLLLDNCYGKNDCKCSLDKNENVLDKLNAFKDRNEIKIIFTLRPNVRRKLDMLFSSHRLFENCFEIDCNQEQYQIAFKEKENILKRYCERFEITIEAKRKNENRQNEFEISKNGKIILCRDTIDLILNSNPVIGFPLACRLFAFRKEVTKLGYRFFIHPTTDYIRSINDIRKEGEMNPDMKVRYVTLCYILLNGNLEINRINLHHFNRILKNCFAFNNGHLMECHVYKIKESVEDMTEHYLKVDDIKEEYFFKHQSVCEAVALSYFTVDPVVVIPVIDITLIKDIVRLGKRDMGKSSMLMVVPSNLYTNLVERLLTIFHSIFRNQSFEFVKTLCDSYIMKQDDELFLRTLIDRFSGVITKDSKTVSYQSTVETITFYFPAAVLLYLSRKNEVDKSIEVILRVLGNVVQTNVDDKIVCACKSAILHLFVTFVDMRKLI